MAARVLPFNCIAATGCSSCVTHCPLPGALLLEGARVHVDTHVCDGCGRCREVCPAPEPAIDILPVLP